MAKSATKIFDGRGDLRLLARKIETRSHGSKRYPYSNAIAHGTLFAMIHSQFALRDLVECEYKAPTLEKLRHRWMMMIHSTRRFFVGVDGEPENEVTVTEIDLLVRSHSEAH